MRTSGEGPGLNRLAREMSPYLQQHARNPVDWYPWGGEAFARARAEDKPIFLSVGYSTCHWCHVMERESFGREDVARLLNAHFVAIKVDREERPDIDAIYMTAAQLFTGRGGWPNSVWLTSDGRPWFAGTYFPREDRPGMPGFLTVLARLAEIWRTRRADVEEQARRMSEAVQQQIAPPGTRQGGGELRRELVSQAISGLRQAFDARDGGWGGAPKFPPHGSLRLLLYECRRTREEDLLAMVMRTLDAMAGGGIHDHIGGGFHRYATDSRWFLPHFEKMLYDNALLSRAYVDAALLTGNASAGEVARGIYDWVLREMTGPEGAFYSAVDADSEGEEGKFYLWTRREVMEALGSEEGEYFCRAYDIVEGGNFSEEASARRPGACVLHLSHPLEEVAQAEGTGSDMLRARLARDRRRLRERRNRRVWPQVDDKVLASWNGLMLGSLAYAGAHLGEAGYVRAAERAARFILATMRRDGRLLRTYREGELRHKAYLDDYAFVAGGLLDLWEATGERRWLEEAEGLMGVLLERYHDRQGGGFFFTSDDHEDLLARTKDPLDHALPSGNGTAAHVLLRLGVALGDADYRALAGECLQAFLPVMERAPHGTENLILALAHYLDGADQGGVGTGTDARSPHARVRRGPVTVEIYIPRSRVAPGERLALALKLTIDEGWHVHSNQPREESLVPTAVSLVSAFPGELVGVVYPPGEEVHLDISSQPLSVYRGEVWIQGFVEIARDAAEGPRDVTLDVTVQPCGHDRCLVSESIRLVSPVNVDPRAPGEETRGRGIFLAGDNLQR